MNINNDVLQLIFMGLSAFFGGISGVLLVVLFL